MEKSKNTREEEIAENNNKKKVNNNDKSIKQVHNTRYNEEHSPCLYDVPHISYEALFGAPKHPAHKARPGASVTRLIVPLIVFHLTLIWKTNLYSYLFLSILCLYENFKCH